MTLPAVNGLVSRDQEQPIPFQALLELHTRVLGQLSGGCTLAATLTGIATEIEQLLPEMRCVILLLDSEHGKLRCGAAPHVGTEWLPWLDDLAVGPRQGSCGTAIHFGREVIVDDIGASPLYVGAFREAALAEGIRSSWSLPIRAGTGEQLGTFALYSDRPHEPTSLERLLVDRCRHLTAIAIEQSRLYGALSSSEERFRTAFDANVVGMALTSPQGRVARVNQALISLLGAAAGDLIGAAAEQLVTIDHRECVRDGLAELRDHGGDGFQTEASAQTVAGSIFPVTLIVSRMNDSSGGLEGFCLHVQDDTERHARAREYAARREAEVAKQQAERASRAKSWFLSGLAHEVHTPMSVILGYTELLESLPLDAERRVTAQERISKAAHHVVSLMDDVLDVSKIESGALPLASDRLCVLDLLLESIALVEPLADRRSLRIHLSRERAGRIHVLADRRRAIQVIVNVLTNAIKYNRDGGNIYAEASILAGQGVIAVADEGPGFTFDTDHDWPQPFDRHGAERTGVQGSGLGLPLSRSLVETMGGELRLSTQPRRGAVVEVFLPLCGQDKKERSRSTDSSGLSSTKK
jgi:PAS domain S-box-containing protein